MLTLIRHRPAMLAATIATVGIHLSTACASWAEDNDRDIAISIASLPPSIIRTIPTCGDTEVDALTVSRISVTFSKDMRDGSWSWAQMSKDHFPTFAGRPRYLEDKRTCIVDVRLEPGKTYVIRLNSPNHRNFKDLDGHSAMPYLLVFRTKPPGDGRNDHPRE